MTETISVQDPHVLLQSLLTFGKSPDGSVERDLAEAIGRLQAALDASKAECERLKAEVEDRDSQIEELNQEAETVSADFEKDATRVVRRLLEKLKFDFTEGWSADNAEEYISECLKDMEAQRQRAQARLAALEKQAGVSELDIASAIGSHVSVGWGDGIVVGIADAARAVRSILLCPQQPAQEGEGLGTMDSGTNRTSECEQQQSKVRE